MNITYFGHSTFMTEMGGTKLLFDPFITVNPSAKNIDLSTIIPDFILVSHAHGDHILDVMAIANQSGATIVSTPEVISWFVKQGASKTIQMNFGGSVQLGNNKVKMVSAVHTSSFPDGTPGGVPAGFVVEGGGKCFFYAGDTCLSYDHQLIALFHTVDLAILPIGDHFTMGYKEAAKCSQFVNSKNVLGVHYNTFPPITIDSQAAIDYFKAQGLNLILMDIGQSQSF